MPPLFTIRGKLSYTIVRELYEGGMGIVYEAEQEGVCNFAKRVAIKIIREQCARQQLFLENFIGEAKLVADLIHTNIVQTYHLGEAGGRYYIAMELINGVNLEQLSQQLLAKERTLPVELAVFITSRIARGLAYAHAKCDRNGAPLGIVHRDVSFKNILVAFEGDVKLTDFGIAKARGLLQDQEGEVAAGKADYMSPEQADFQVTDRRSDLFSAGIVLAHLLLGRNVFKAETAEASRQRVLGMPIPDFRALDPRIDDPLNGILKRALARLPADRYQTANELLHDLEYHIYSAGYGPTNETLGRFVRELCGQLTPAELSGGRGNTVVIPAPRPPAPS